MCGIHGILQLNGQQDNVTDIIKAMGNVTQHRGPDDEGIYVGNGITIGQRRLSIIDLETGHQPICNEDETIWLACNGEIYNFQEQREILKNKGHKFRTGSDSEVIIHLYEEYGEDCLQHISGMFAFALWDEKQKKLLLARDRLGIKPLYVCRDGNRFVFASEAKSILQLPGFSPQLNHQALHQYLSLGYVPTPLSLFEGIDKLPAASLTIIQNGTITTKPYWQFQIQPDAAKSENDWIEETVETLKQSVQSQMVSDVPLGAFLSGGIDSSAIVALMSQFSDRPIKTYSIGFDTGKAGSFYNELPYAKQVADLFKTDHKEILVRPDVIELLPKLLWQMDEPMADAAFITTYLVAEFARKDVTVILSGAGGDELFGGYRRYLGEYYSNVYNKLPSVLRKNLLAPIASKLPSDRHSALLNLSRYARSFILSSALPPTERYRNYVQVFSDDVLSDLMKNYPSDRSDLFLDAFSSADAAGDLDKLFQVDCKTQLPDDILMLTDKMTMATSLECRVPLLDDKVIALAANMPSGLKIKGRTLKYILKKSFSGTLPDDILYRKKRGFGAPMGSWLKKELSPLMKSILSEQSIKSRNVFNWQQIEQTMQAHETNKADHTDHLQALLNFEIWARMYLDGVSPTDLTDQLKQELN